MLVDIRKYTLSLLIIALVVMSGCSKNVLIDEQSSELLNYDFRISDIKNIDNTLSDQKYSYSTYIDKKFIAVITYKSEKASIEQYLINKDGEIDLTASKDSNFIISLPANRTITYTWNVKNTINKGIVQLENRSWIEIPIPDSENGKDGVNYDRQNFYFKPLKSGKQKIVMRYEHQTEQQDESFEITLNIKIQ